MASGFSTKRLRSRESGKLLNWAIRTFDTIQIAKKNEPFDALDVWLGKKNKVNAVVREDVYLTVPKRKKKIIKAIVEYQGPIQAPIFNGDKLGILKIYIEGKLKKQLDIYSNEDIKRSNIFSRLLKSLNFLVWGDA